MLYNERSLDGNNLQYIEDDAFSNLTSLETLLAIVQEMLTVSLLYT